MIEHPNQFLVLEKLIMDERPDEIDENTLGDESNPLSVNAKNEIGDTPEELMVPVIISGRKESSAV